MATTTVTTALQWMVVDGLLQQLTYQPKAPVLKLGSDIVKYTSFAMFSGNPVAGPAGYAMYDNEARISPPWPTPANEQANPPKYMRSFGQLGHSKRFLPICAPGLDLANADPDKPPGQTNAEWYLVNQIAWHAARYADVVHIQAQSMIGPGASAYQAFTTSAASQVTLANPYCVLSAGLSTAHGTPDENVAAFQSVFPGISWFWLNVPQPNPDYAGASSILQQCETIAGLLTRASTAPATWRSAHADRGVVENERGLLLVILSASELQRDLLPGVRAQREAVPGVPGVGVEVGVGVQGRQDLA
jgi:hypothetical protein